MTSAVLPWQAAALAQWLAQRSPHPAWLVVGPSGHGGERLAQAMAAAWLCDGPTQTGACGHCEACHWLNSGSHPDFRLVQPDAPEETSETLARQEIKVDAIRALSEWAVHTAHRQRKVVVIAPAQSMNTQAANALLKLLEEPPPTLRFFLSASDARQLPATIVSRCVTVKAPLASPAQAQAWLQAQSVPTAQLPLVVAQSGGAPLFAVDCAQPDVQQQRSAFLDLLAKPAVLSALAVGDSIDALSRSARRRALQFRLHWLACWVHDVCCVAAGGAPRFNPDYNTEIVALAKNLPNVATHRYYANLINRLRWIQHPLNPRLVLEAAIIEYKRIAIGGS